MKAILTVGLQNSGKSFWSKQFVKDNQNWKRINRDSFRYMLSDYTYTKENENLVTKLVQASIVECLKNGFNLVLDEMNLSKNTRNKNINFIKETAEELGVDIEIEIKEFPITLGEAMARHPKDKPFDVSVVKNTYKKYEVECKQMIERAKPKIEYDDSLPNCILMDIDGTLSNSCDRKIFDDSLIHLDRVIKPVRFLNWMCNEWSYSGESGFKIIIMSGRQDSCREQTEKWLDDNNIYYDELYMREARDNRKDTIIKKELYEEYIKGKYNVVFVVDDRKCVCQQWVDMGLFVFDVSQDPLAKNIF